MDNKYLSSSLLDSSNTPVSIQITAGSFVYLAFKGIYSYEVEYK